MCARRYDPGLNGATPGKRSAKNVHGEKERERKKERKEDRWKERTAREKEGANGRRYSKRIRDRMSGNSKTSQTTPTGASSLGIAVIPGKCAISSVIGYYYVVITGFDLG